MEPLLEEPLEPRGRSLFLTFGQICAMVCSRNPPEPEAYKPIDISNDPELLKLAEEVHTTHEPRILRRDDEDLAVLMPVGPKRKRRRRAKTPRPTMKPSSPRLVAGRMSIRTSCLPISMRIGPAAPVHPLSYEVDG